MIAQIVNIIGIVLQILLFIVVAISLFHKGGDTNIDHDYFGY